VSEAARRGIRAARFGMVVNAVLAAVKLVAGVVGNTYALVADAVESIADIFASLVVWGGIAVAARPADDDHPYGHGKAEALATAAVSLMLLVAAAGIVVEALREIRTPHQVPAPWTLLVLVGVMAVKWGLSRRVHAVGADTGSSAVQADAAHHLSDAITSGAAFVGIAVGVVGTKLTGRPGWAAADDWAALLAAGVVGFNGISMVRSALHDLMDRTPGPDVVEPVRRAAAGVPGVRAVEKLAVRKTGTTYAVAIHAQADASTRLDDAHVLSGMVKSAIRAAVPRVDTVLVHMEPYDDVEPAPGPAPAPAASATTRAHGG